MLIGALAGNFGHGNRTEDDDVPIGPHHGFTDRDGVYHPAPGCNVIITGLNSEPITGKANTMGCSKGKPAPAKTGGGKKK